jgi:hypothetical protein
MKANYKLYKTTITMKKKILVLVLSVALVLSANLRAQVTIGSVNAPKAGAILDLNSGAKGGLILSNVALDNIGEIPAGFPGMSGADIAVAKAQLKGAMVYNTNPNTCVGVHAWDGNHWARPISPQKSEGKPLSIASNVANLVGDDDIVFTVDIEAKTYVWYINKNNAGYEYFGVTTEPKLEAPIPAGKIKVKVIADNCHVLEESNEVNLQLESLSPNFGSEAGDNYVYLYGDFPYASSDDYVQTDLVAHYDGINNQNLGDKLHDSNITEWKDLCGNNYDVKLRKGHAGTGNHADAIDVTTLAQCAGAQWYSNGFLFNDYSYFANIPADPAAENALYEIMPELPYGNDNYTIEAVFDPSQRSSTYDGFVGWGKQGADYTANSTMFFCPPTENAQPTFRHFWWSNDVDVKFTDTNSNNIKNFAITYDNSVLASPNNRTFYYNGSENSINYVGTNCVGSTTNYCREKTNKNTAKCGSFFVGQTVHVNTYDKCIAAGTNFHRDTYTHGNKMFSIRVYKGALTPEQIAANYEVDKRRFTAPPQVKIGGNLSPEVVVLSPHFLMCKVPSSTGGLGTADVEVTNADGTSLILDDAYKYVDATTDFYVSEIKPIIGSAGENLKLTGNGFGDITKIEAGGSDCPIKTSTRTSTFCECTLPANPPGEVDIMIITNTKPYRFAKVFEYK